MRPIRGQSDADGDRLSSCSPIESWTNGEGEASGGGVVAADREGSTASYDTAAMWKASGPAPGLFLFDGHESGPREEREVVEHVDSQDPDETGDGQGGEGKHGDQRSPTEHWEDFMGEPLSAPSPSDFVTTQKKRSWAGSLVSEERNRPTRKPRHEEAGVGRGDGRQLPAFNEFVGNPWGDLGGVDASRRRTRVPVHLTTPRHDHHSPLHNLVYQSGANVSGKAPTPHSTSTVAPDARPRPRGMAATEKAGAYLPRTGARTRGYSSRLSSVMDMDDEDGGSLLRSPSLRQARIDRDRRELEELEERRAALQEALKDAGSDSPGEYADERGPRWIGGYAPELLGNRSRPDDGEPRTKAVDELSRYGRAEGADDEEQSEDDDREGTTGVREKWSAIPYTKAWQYRKDQQEQERAVRASGDGARRRVNGDSLRHGSEVPQGRRDAPEERDWSEAGRHPRGSEQYDEEESGFQSREEDMDCDREEGLKAQYDAWMGPGVGGAIPTAVARDEGVADAPVIVDNPADEKWTVQFDDPEALLRGQSPDFVRVVWWDDKPTVIFTVFNYKYTENEEINRQIEQAVTGMTTLLTGEVDFCVIPPEADWTRELGSGELPFTWAIRGLSEAGAWEMVKVRVATTKGVSIITYPRSLVNPHWVCSLGGFLRPDEEAIRTTVMYVLKSEYMLERVEYMTRSNANLAHIPEGRRLGYILDSLKVRVTVTKKGGYVANIYIQPPSDDMDTWREWRDELRACRFNAFICGAGKALRVFWCAGCRGADHEETDCVFPRMRGWRGPEAGSGSHVRALPTAGLARDGAGRGKLVTWRGAGRGGISGPGRGRGDWRGQQNPRRGTGYEGRGGYREQGGHAGRGGRGGAKRGAWSPVVRR